MNVDFNNLRKQACLSYNRLCYKLNNEITGNLADDIKKDMDELKMHIGGIASVYEPNNEDFKCIEIDLMEFEGEK